MPITTLLIYALFFSLFAGALFSPILGVAGYLSVHTLYNPHSWWGSGFPQVLPRPSLLAMLFILFSTLLHLRDLNWTFSRREVQFYLFLASAWISSFVFGVGVQDVGWEYLIKFTKIFLFLFFLLRIATTFLHLKIIAWTLIVSALFLSYQGHIVSSGYFTEGRLDQIGGTDFREANQLASFLTMAVAFLGIRLLRASLWKKALYTLGIALILDTIVLTQSRAVFLGLLLAGPYIIFRAPRYYRKQIVLCAGLGVLLFFMLADPKFIDRMSTISSEAKDLPMKITKVEEKVLHRIDFWRASLHIFRDHPMGIGVKNFEAVVSLYDPRNPGLDAHNTYVLCYSELGIPGIILFLIIIFESLFQMKRIRSAAEGTPYEKEISLYAFALMAIHLVYLLGVMMTHSILYSEMLWIILSLPICLEMATKKLLSEPSDTE
ncbi:MAG: O-antigen ligase family protein [Syntrophaceae bacterium]|nr:O-antigen ligase family protein [Syntrophaceae bacterium]